MKKISAIGFDWGGVIFQYGSKPFAEAASEFLGISQEEFLRVYYLYNFMINKGAESKSVDQANEMWSRILTELRISDRLEEFMLFIQSRPKGEVSVEILELLQKLKRHGWKLGMLSNMSTERAKQIREYDFLNVFDVVLFSCEIDCMKPERQAFEKLAHALNTPLDELVFIDDSVHSLSTAQEAGFVPILFQSNQQLIADLVKLGIET